MHKSKLCSLGIDCRTGDLQTGATFWGNALGMAPKIDPNDPNYVHLGTGQETALVFVQQVKHDPRVHLDIETDDVAAEVARLEGLGATRVKQVGTWWVMEAPTGHRFCVVRAQRGPLGDDANVW